MAGAVVVGLALTGCDSNSGDDNVAAASTEPVESSSAAPANTYVVDSGDTLSGIAAGYGLSLSELVDANEWSDGSDHAIFPGDVIALPDDAVAVSTTRPPSNNNGGNDDDGNDDDDGNTSTTAGSGAAATSGGYTSTGEPSLDGLILAITEPLVDGRYLTNVPTVSGDGSTITFELLQCPESYGTAPGSCLTFLDFEVSTMASMRVGSGTASVLLLDGISAPQSYRITTEELSRLLAGEAPADDAPDGFEFDPVDGYVVTVQNGAVTSAEQVWLS